ncbi:hypothetical protein H0H87_001437, partial [Tephrocybe sp. NHM501043]
MSPMEFRRRMSDELAMISVDDLKEILGGIVVAPDIAKFEPPSVSSTPLFFIYRLRRLTLLCDGRERNDLPTDGSKQSQQVTDALFDDEDSLSKSSFIEHDDSMAPLDTSTQISSENITKSLRQVEEDRALVDRVLDDERPEDRLLGFLASSKSNIAIRWQQGKLIGAGLFSSVYSAVNLDSGSLMAVKEIKFQELSSLPTLDAQIKNELDVMEMLHHRSVVEYYGIEVHRDK